MASKRSEALKKLYREWVAALQANPEMPLDEPRHLFAHWERITGEPNLSSIAARENTYPLVAYK